MQASGLLAALATILIPILSASLLFVGVQANSPQEQKQHQQEQEQFCSLNNQEKPPPSPPLPSEACFRAAVFEHYRKNLTDIRELVADSLAVYAKVAKLSSQNGANIVVFPEDGIFMGSKEQVLPVLTEIPDPSKLTSLNNNPCVQRKLYESSEILTNLSCIARENNLYVVANFGTKQTCPPGELVGDQICPQIGQFTLNTDVVLDPRGNFIKRYRKFNLFIEIFDKSPELETTYFDTPFGRFGVFTCFDMMFKRPAVDLVERLHIDTAIFPTWWFDELPLLSAIQFQEGWSWTNRVNLLASNIHRLNVGSAGSGIYSGLQSVYTSAAATKPRLVIASLPSTTKFISGGQNCSQQFEPLILDVETNEPALDDYTYKHYSLLASDSIYKLTEKQVTKKTICSGQVCCTIGYKIRETTNSSNSGESASFAQRLILIARDARRPGHFNWYEQVCALATLERPIEMKKLDQVRYSKEALVDFEQLSLRGTFNSKYVYPITAHNVSQLIARDKREFNCDQLGRKQDNLISCKLNYIRSEKEANKQGVYSFGMYGRLYDKDKMPDGW